MITLVVVGAWACVRAYENVSCMTVYSSLTRRTAPLQFPGRTGVACPSIQFLLHVLYYVMRTVRRCVYSVGGRAEWSILFTRCGKSKYVYISLWRSPLAGFPPGCVYDQLWWRTEQLSLCCLFLTSICGLSCRFSLNVCFVRLTRVSTCW